MNGTVRTMRLLRTLLMGVPLSTATLLSCGASPASAADTTASASGADALDEITVTARRREERLQDVPIAVTAFDQTTLERLQVQRLDDLSTLVPDLNILQTQGSQNGASISMRGIGDDASTIEDEPAVGLYIDGVYISQNIGSLLNMLDISQVEVLRGPQGTLYGRNSMGGAIKIETQRPTTDEFKSTGEVTVGSFDRIDGKASMNVPLNDELAANVSVISRESNGWYTNPANGQQLNRTDSQAVRAGVMWTPSDSLNVFWSADFSVDHSGLFVGTPMTTETGSAVPVYGLYKAEPTLPDLNHYSGWGTSVQVHWTNPISEVVSITAVRGENYVQSFDLSDAPGGLKLTRPAFDQRQTTQEFQFNSKWSGPLTLTSGIFYFYEHAYEELDLIIDPTTVLPYASGQDSRSFAVYSELTYAIEPSLKLSLGGRETWDRKSIDWGGIYAGISGAQPYRDFTPRALLSWQATPDFMTYASYSKGYAAGRYQAFPGSASVAAVSTPPQFVTAYEVGIKSQWLQRRVTANLAVFDNKYTDLGVNVNGTGNLIQVLSADSVARGAELEVAVRPIPQLTLNGQVSRLFTRYTSAPDVAGAPNVGDEMRYSPPWSGATNGDYRVPFGASRNVVLGAGAIWSDTNPTTGVPNTPFFFQKPYWLFNARLGIEDTAKNWLVELAGQNLSNTAWFDTASVLSGGVRWYNPPRTWSLRVRLSL